MKVFVAGPRAVRTLNEKVTDILSHMIEKQSTVLLGDASGVDCLAQKYFAEAKYPNVHVYASNGKARNNVGGWSIHSVEVPTGMKGFDFYSQKDMRMAQDADNGFMVWNGRSKGTLNNIINLISKNKKTVIYFIPNQKIYCVEKIEHVEEIAKSMGPEVLALFYELCLKNVIPKENVGYEQLSFSGPFSSELGNYV